MFPPSRRFRSNSAHRTGRRSGRSRRRAARRQKSAIPAIFWFAALTAITWVVGLNVTAHDTLVGPEAPDYSPDNWHIEPEAQPIPETDEKQWEALNGGQVFFEPDSVNLQLDDTGTLAAEHRFSLQPFNLNIPVQLRITASMSTQSVLAGRKYWYSGVLHTRFYDKNDELIRYVPLIKALDGTHDNVAVDRVLSVPESAVSMGVLIRLIKTNGMVKLQNVQLTQVTPSGVFKAASSAMAFTWVAFAIYFIVRHAALVRNSVGLLIAIACALLLLGILAPSGSMSVVTASLREFFQAFILQSNLMNTPGSTAYEIGTWMSSNTGIPKIGHAAIFLILSFVYFLSNQFRHISFLQAMSWVVLLALATEAMQLFIYGRSGQLIDVGIDLTGALLGWLLAQMVRLIFRKPFRKAY